MLDRNSSRQLRAFRAAAFGIFLTLSFFFPSYAYAQTIFVTEYQSEADVKVYITKYRGDADLVVYIVKYKSEASNRNGKWFYVDSKFKSDKIIFFT